MLNISFISNQENKIKSQFNSNINNDKIQDYNKKFNYKWATDTSKLNIYIILQDYVWVT